MAELKTEAEKERKAEKETEKGRDAERMTQKGREVETKIGEREGGGGSGR